MRLACLPLIIVLCSPAWAADPISKITIRAASEKQAKRMVMDQLSDLLISDGRGGVKGHRPKVPLSDLWFVTRTHGTMTPGVCASSIVIVRFRAVDAGPRNADTPVAASDLETSHRFKLLAPVKPGDLDQLDTEGQVRADRECAEIDARKADMISAPGEDALVNALWLLRAAKKQNGRPVVPLDCDGSPQPCDALFDELDPAKVESVDICPADSGSHCYRVEEGDVAAEIRSDAHDHVTAIKLDQEVIFADPRVD